MKKGRVSMPLVLESLHECVPRDAEVVAHQQRVEPGRAGVRSIRSRWRLKTGDTGESLVVLPVHAPAFRQQLVTALDLGAEQRGSHVGEPVVVPHLGEPVAPLRVHALTAEPLDVRGERGVVGGDRPTFAARHDLVAEEGEGGEVTQAARGTPLVRRERCLGGVLDQREAVPLGHPRSGCIDAGMP